MSGIALNPQSQAWPIGRNDIFAKAFKSVQNGIDGLSALKNDTDGFYDALQTANYAFKGIGHALNNSSAFSTVASNVTGGLNVLDFAQTVSDFSFWVNGHYKTSSKFCTFGKAMITIASFGGAALWLGHMGFYNLGLISAKIGGIPFLGAVFKVVSSVGLGNIVVGAVAFGYASFAADAVNCYDKAKNTEQKTKAAIDIASRVSNVVLYTLLLIPGVGVPSLVVVGVFAKGLGVVSFFYYHFNKKQCDSV